jgi:hypothetical protein
MSVTLSACGSNVTVPTVPGDALPGHAASVVELDASRVASDAVHTRDSSADVSGRSPIPGRRRTGCKRA